MNFTIQKAFAFLSLVMVTLLAGAQAALPTGFNFDETTPVGWTENLGTNGLTRYASGQAGQSCKLDATGENVVLYFAEEPGVLNYYMKGWNTGGSWQGTFTVEESANGTSYTALHTFTNDLPTTAYTLFTDTPAPTTRYIRWNFTAKVSGHNAGLDEITLATPIAGNAQEINVVVGTTNIPSGFTHSMGSATSQVFTIENQGLGQALTISDITLSGANASEFSLGTISTSVSAQSSEDFTLNFSPIGMGSRFCTITITNDDSSEGTYVINVYAISGPLASEPTAQATDITFQNVYAWDFNTTINAAPSTAENFLVLRKNGAAVTETPTDGSTYMKGELIGGSQVVYNGPAAQFNARAVESGSTYHFAVFAYNGPATFENYLTTTPLIGSVLAPAPSIGAFYSSVDNTNPNFVTQLNAVMNPANYYQIFYSSYISTLINDFYVRDTVVDGMSSNTVECQYSGTPYVYSSNFIWWTGTGPASLSREHSFPQSWMPTYNDANFSSSNEVSDLHNLFPILQAECNAVRSNYPYGEVETITSSYLDCKYGNNTNGQKVYEMRDSFKGNAARGVMYHAAKNNTATLNFSFPEQVSLTIPYGQNEYVIKSWHFQDLPDSYEITRNEYIQFQQHNRNAFIDSVNYPCYIRFANLTKFAPIVTTSGAVLTCTDPGISYQWYKDGAMIDGATSASYTSTGEGSYNVTMQQFSQCPVQTSNTVLINSVNDIDEGVDFLIYPNPAKSDFNMKVNSNLSGNARLTITDLQGKVVHITNTVITNGTNNIAVSTDLSAGVYNVELNTGLNRVSQKLIIE